MGWFNELMHDTGLRSDSTWRAFSNSDSREQREREERREREQQLRDFDELMRQRRGR